MRPYRRATDGELSDRERYIRRLLTHCLYRSESSWRIQDKFSISRSEADRAIDRAQGKLYEEFWVMTGQDWTFLAVEFYRSVIRSKQATVAEKLKAQTRTDRNLGLEAPKRLEVTDGLDKVTDEQLRAEPERNGIELSSDDEAASSPEK